MYQYVFVVIKAIVFGGQCEVVTELFNAECDAQKRWRELVDEAVSIIENSSYNIYENSEKYLYYEDRGAEHPELFSTKIYVEEKPVM